MNVNIVKSKKLFITNYSYVVIDEEKNVAIIIDPSWDEKAIVNIIKESGCEKVFILITHSHFDHVHSAEYLADTFICNIYISKKESEFYDYIPKYCKFMYEGKYNFCGIEVEVIHTPGHTIGSQCFLIDKLLFTGDTLFIEGCGVTFGSGGSSISMFDSMNKLKNRIHESTKVYPGHSYGKVPGQEFGYLLKYNIYLNFNEVSDFINFRERKGQNKLFDYK